MNRLVIALTALVAGYLYLGLRLSPDIGLPIWLGLAAALLLVTTYPMSWRLKNRPTKLQTAFRWVTYFDMGFLSFLISLAVLRDLVFLPVLWLRPDWGTPIFSATGSLVVVGLSLLGVGIGAAWALTGPRIKHVDVPIENLPPELEGFKIAQISDLHVGPTIGESYVSRVVKLVNGLDPHLTVLTGDIADGHHHEWRHATQPLKELRPAGRTMYVPGNHEYYWNGPKWIEEFESLGMQTLLNSRTIVAHEGHEILVAGVLDPAVRIAHRHLKPDARAAHGPVHPAPLKILLSHHPGIAREAAETGFHLQLSGHTHAGQFFPWTLFVGKVHEYARGLKACASMWVYVNPGTGTSSPPIRLGTTPEITLVKLVRGPDALSGAC